MKMKNIAAVAMAGCMAASLAACGGSASSAATDASSAASTEAATSEATEATGTSANGFTVQLGSNPETLDPALNSAIDGANTLITVFLGCPERPRQRGRQDPDHPAGLSLLLLR